MAEVMATKSGTPDKMEFWLKIISVFKRKNHHPDPKT